MAPLIDEVPEMPFWKDHVPFPSQPTEQVVRIPFVRPRFSEESIGRDRGRLFIWANDHSCNILILIIAS